MTCHGVARAFQHCDVNVGWRPMLTTQATPVRSKPGAGIILDTCRAAEGVALQSVRNPSASDTPRKRPAVRGVDGNFYVWGYKRAGAHTGWLRLDHIGPDPGFASKRFADGPASEDFEVGRQQCVRASRSGCGKKSLTKPVMRVTAEKVHFRYSPRGTSVHYLHAGDTVLILIANGPHGFHFAQVVRAATDGSARAGMRGWIASTALTRVG